MTRHTVICHRRQVRIVTLVSMQPIHEDKKKSNRRRLCERPLKWQKS